MAEILLSTLNARYAHSSFGLRYLFANLGELRSRAEILEFDTSQRPIDIAEAILTRRPKILGLGVYIWNVAPTTELVAHAEVLRVGPVGERRRAVVRGVDESAIHVQAVYARRIVPRRDDVHRRRRWKHARRGQRVRRAIEVRRRRPQSDDRIRTLLADRERAQRGAVREGHDALQ